MPEVNKKTLKCNKPRKTPGHKTKSHIVKACENGKEKIIRFGQQGVSTAGKKQDKKSKARRASFKVKKEKRTLYPILWQTSGGQPRGDTLYGLRHPLPYVLPMIRIFSFELSFFQFPNCVQELISGVCALRLGCSLSVPGEKYDCLLQF